MKASPSAIASKYFFVLFASAVVLYPLVWMVTMAFKPYPEWTTVAGLTWLPQNPTLQNFEFIFLVKQKALL